MYKYKYQKCLEYPVAILGKGYHYDGVGTKGSFNIVVFLDHHLSCELGCCPHVQNLKGLVSKRNIRIGDGDGD